MAKSNKSEKPDPRANLPEEFRPAEWVYCNPYRPPNDTKATPHRDVLYASIGRALTQWEVLETVLAMQFQALIGSPRRSAFMAYGSILASGSRIEMLESVAEIELSGSKLADCKTLLQDVRRLAGTRNLLAHGVVVSIGDGAWPSDDPRMSPEGLYAVVAAPYNKNKFKAGTVGPTYVYSAQTVEGITREFQKATSRAGAITGPQGHQKYWRFNLVEPQESPAQGSDK